jgi:hypothetical protein
MLVSKLMHRVLLQINATAATRLNIAVATGAEAGSVLEQALELVRCQHASCPWRKAAQYQNLAAHQIVSYCALCALQANRECIPMQANAAISEYLYRSELSAAATIFSTNL